MRLPSVPVPGERDLSGGLPVRAGVLRVAQWPGSVLILVLLFTFVLYVPTLNDWFQSDDVLYLRAAQLNSPPELVIEAFDFRDTAEPVSLLRGHYRPLFAVTILTEAEVFGLHALPYHLVSLVVHLASVALVWLIAMKAARRPLVAHIAALVFAFHPTYAVAVGWISEHTVMLATLGSLACLWSFTKALEDTSRSRLWYVVSVASYLAALLYHPKAMPVLVALVAYYFLVHRGAVREVLSPRSWLRFLPFVVIALFSLVVSLWLRGEDPHLEASFKYGSHVYENYLSYLRMAVVPEPLLADAELASGLIASLAWLGIGAWLLRDPRRWARHLFALVWFLTAFLPAITFAWGAYPRELYVAGPGFALVLSFGLVSVLDSVSRLRYARVVALAALVVLVALASQRTIMNERDQGLLAAESQDFIQELRETYPVLPERATLHVVGAPFSLRIFDDSRLEAVVSIYYGDIDVRAATEEEAAALEESPGPDDYVFRYSGYYVGRY